MARRYPANAVRRRPSGTTSARSAEAAGRYSSESSPNSAVRAMTHPSARAWESMRAAAAAPNMDSAIEIRRPNLSARRPPTAADARLPAPYPLAARPAWATENPESTRYSTRKTVTKLPNRLTNDPANRIHAGRGRARMSRHRFWGGAATPLYTGPAGSDEHGDAAAAAGL